MDGADPERADGARLPRETRLRRAADFAAAYREGVRARGDVFVLVARPNGLPYSRLGLSVGKRCWKRAVRRNRVRRVFREAFRLERARLPAGLDLVLIAARAGLDPRLAEARAELCALAWRARRKLAPDAGVAP